MNTLYRRRNYYINEDLLDKVSVDEVEDEDKDEDKSIKNDENADCNVKLWFGYEYGNTATCVADCTYDYLDNCSFVKKFKAPVYDWSHYKIGINFYSDDMKAEDLMSLIIFMSFKSGERMRVMDENTNASCYVEIERYYLNVDLREFGKFFNGFFPDENAERLFKIFVRMCITRRLLRRSEYSDLPGYQVQLGYEKHNLVDDYGNFILDRCYSESRKLDNCDLVRVKSGDKYNIIDKNGKLLLDEKKWFDMQGYMMCDGYIKIGYETGYGTYKFWYNFIDIDGNFLNDEHYDDCGNFHEGFASVNKNGKCNFIDTDGNIVFDEWFDECGTFINGYASVRKDSKWNFINKKGKYLSKEWFDECHNFEYGMVVVKSKKCNMIDNKGKIVLATWVDNIGTFVEGFSVVELKNKFNYIDKKGNLLSNDWFSKCINFSEGFGIVTNKKSKKNFIDKDGNFLSKDWYDDACSFECGFGRVHDVNKKGWNYIDRNGNILSPNLWFKHIDNFCDFGLALVNENNYDRYNFIRRDGSLVIDGWFKFADHFREGFAQVEMIINGRESYNFINSKGTIISPDVWFRGVSNFRNGVAKVTDFSGKINYINEDGKLLFKDWFGYKNMVSVEDDMLVTMNGLAVDFNGDYVTLI